MAALAEFPPEILSAICSSLNGFDIARLWVSGDRKLLSRLANAVTRFELALAQTISCSWPKLISQFKRLESLIIRPRSENHRIWFRDVDLYGISSTLKHLELEFDNLESSLFGLPFVVSDAYPDPIWSPPTEGEMTFSPFPVATHFPCLETVRFGGEMKFPSILIPMLPECLLALSLPYVKLGAFVLRQLPPTLTQLELPTLSQIEFDEIDLKFPSNITHLSIPSLNLFEWKPSMVSLPPTLLHLAATFEMLELDDPMIPLPPTLVCCDVHGWSEICNELRISIPPGLRHLMAENHKFPFEIETLPTGLQTLDVASIHGLSSASLSYLPSSLTRIITGPVEMPPESFFSLPSSLRSLSIPTTFVDLGYPFMSTLEELIIPAMDHEAFQYAPKLKKLEIWDFVPPKWVRAPLRLGNLTSLEHLRIVTCATNWMDTEVESYPESLQILEIPLLQPNSYQRLPRGLTHLDIEQDGIYNESIAHLPPGLTELTLRMETRKKSISDSSVALLPRTLVVLALPDSFELTDVGIANFPRHMRRCILGKAPLLTNACASLFPRQLISLELRASDLLSNACVKHLPRTLTRLLLSSALVTEDCSPDLPPRLSDFELNVATTRTPNMSKMEEFLSSLPKL